MCSWCPGAPASPQQQTAAGSIGLFLFSCDAAVFCTQNTAADAANLVLTQFGSNGLELGVSQQVRNVANICGTGTGAGVLNVYLFP